MKKLIYTLLFVSALVADVFSQQQAGPAAGDFFINVDFARFKNDSQSGYLEVYYGLYPNMLKYEKVDGVYHAGVMLKTRILDRLSGEPVAENAFPLKIAEKDTSQPWYRYPLVTQAGFVLPIGDYSMEVTAVDSLASESQDSVSMSFVVSAFSEPVQMSDIEMCKKIARSQNKTDLFYKNGLEVVPIPSLVLGIATSPVLFYYSELYNLTPGQNYTVKTYILDANDNIVRESTKQQAYNAETGLLVGNLTITSHPAGKYTFRCVVLDENENEFTRTQKAFTIFNPHINNKALAEQTEVTKALKKLSLKDMRKEFEMARYVATENEVLMFPQVDTESGVRDFLVKFWTEVSTGRGDKPAITRSDYLDRVETANKNYGAFGRDGWDTDRGRIYILYGEADEVDRSPADSQTKAYQIWRYYSLDRGVEFVFVDRNGYGNLELVHSNMRGELSDRMWERFLQ